MPGTAPDGANGMVPFNVQWENQRPGLLLYNGLLFIGFASHGDNGRWHGWILGYNASTLAQTGSWNTSPNGKGNGIWGAGSGLAADANGNAYVSTGNGDYTVTVPAPPPSTTIDYGDSIVRISLANGIPTPADYFTPYNQANLDTSDADVGSGGVLIPPDSGRTFSRHSDSSRQARHRLRRQSRQNDQRRQPLLQRLHQRSGNYSDRYRKWRPVVYALVLEWQRVYLGQRQ